MAKVIMIQGTMSNVGKSVIVAGLCRIFHQDGYKVAPFKSQNMALNSYITEDGLEMGRAQVMQAEAAGIRPEACMNPILLKPTSDVGSQVIVNGIAIGNMPAREYYQRKKEFIPKIMEAFEQLNRTYDIIVIEGAGSPAEMNLKTDDIVNMGLAELVNAPVLLVGDIDRGGVFAQLYGTVALLEEHERARIQGLIVNKFRGDKAIFKSGIQILEEKCKIPVLGVTPYLQIDLDDEDSLTERFEQHETKAAIDIAVIRLPRISNFTDFNVLEISKNVDLRYVHNVSELKAPDVIIIPGTKNTIEDLLWLRQNGLEAEIMKHAANGKLVFGVCGGYQMLGKSISDPIGVEAKGKIKGIGLLQGQTVFSKEKVRKQVTGRIGTLSGILSNLSGLKVEGYEIHMGQTRKVGHEENLVLEREIVSEGTISPNVYGTYVHGFFDDPIVVSSFISAIAEWKGIKLEEAEQINYREYKEQQYDELASAFREHLDLIKIYEILTKETEE